VIELFDPVLGSWTVVGFQPEGSDHMTVLLADGTILFAGGIAGADWEEGDYWQSVAEAWRLDPPTGSLTRLAPMPSPRAYGVAALLGDGRVLVTGGSDSYDAGVFHQTARAVIYDPSTDRWLATADMPQPIGGGVVVTLADGSVLLAGGFAGGEVGAEVGAEPTAQGTRFVPARATPIDVARPPVPPGGDRLGVNVARVDVARAVANPAAAKTAAASINAFGLDLLRAMLADGTLKPDENAVFSPTSIALALAMARAGAKGETASQMDAVLHTSGWDDLGPGLNAVERALTSRNAMWQDEYHDPPTRELALRIANAAFAQGDWAIERSYLERIGATFGAGVRLVDYIADYEAARKTINAWVSDQTKKRIPELIPEGMLDDLTRLVLVNAIYLKAGWENEFSKDATEPKPFTRLDGSLVKVPTMQQFGGQTIPYARGNGWQATELRYRGRDWSTPLAMTLILPDDLPAFESKLTASQLGRITATLESERERLGVITPGTSGEMCDMGTWPYQVEVFLPRFSAGTQATLADVLKSLGMPVAFTGGVADFTAIHVPKTDAEQLFIGTVIHQANIDVDEKGTEAAAATAIIMQATGGGCVGTEPSPRKTITLRLDHPFLFVLRDVETGAVLFMGRVVDPSVGR
jgi:serpin B